MLSKILFCDKLLATIQVESFCANKIARAPKQTHQTQS